MKVLVNTRLMGQFVGAIICQGHLCCVLLMAHNKAISPHACILEYMIALYSVEIVNVATHQFGVAVV